MDNRTIRMITPFVMVRENPLASTASLREILKNGTHEVTVRSTMTIESRRGFMDRHNPFGKDYASPTGATLPDFDDPAVLDSLRRNNKVYLGSPYRVARVFGAAVPEQGRVLTFKRAVQVNADESVCTLKHVLRATDALAGLAAELKAAGIRLQVVEARASVREMLRAVGLDETLGGIDRVASNILE